jgi:hypothetical protein
VRSGDASVEIKVMRTGNDSVPVRLSWGCSYAPEHTEIVELSAQQVSELTWHEIRLA